MSTSSESAASDTTLPISAIVITLNEAGSIGRCLESLTFCDEVVVVDSGSTDGTIDIAAAAGAHVYNESWKGYVGQKLSAIEKTRNEWVLWIDADERVTPELADSLRRIQNPKSKIQNPRSGYRIRRRAMFCGRWMDHVWSNEWVLRLFRKSEVEFPDRVVHESATVPGEVARLNGVLEHYAYDRIEDYVAKSDRYSRLAAEELLRQGRRVRVWNLVANPLIQFVKLYILKCGFLDGLQGFQVSGLSARYTFYKFLHARRM